MGPCLFPVEYIFCLPHRKTHWTMSVDNIELNICLLGISNVMVTLTFFFLGVNQSGPKMHSVRNHEFYRALG